MNALEFLKANQSKGSGAFLKKAQYLKDNWDWLKYSYAIALRVRSRMEELGMTQKQLSELLGCTQQHVSVLLGGKTNMTLETISHLEKALHFDLIGQVLPLPETSGYLSEPTSAEDAVTSGTSSLVDGYIPRKKKGPKAKR